MGRAEENRSEKDEESPGSSRSEEARRIVEEYAKELREIIRILRRRLFN